MHQQVGFAIVGVMKKVGEKFGRMLDVTMLQLMLR
jgi:L-amino acid N-acyltransferase YncA